MVQIDHTVPKEAMYSDYPYVSGTTKTLPEHFRESSARITDAYHVGERDLVVDIGSNDGTWLMQTLNIVAACLASSQQQTLPASRRMPGCQR
jgi:hypothetical protein